MRWSLSWLLFRWQRGDATLQSPCPGAPSTGTGRFAFRGWMDARLGAEGRELGGTPSDAVGMGTEWGRRDAGSGSDGCGLTSERQASFRASQLAASTRRSNPVRPYDFRHLAGAGLVAYPAFEGDVEGHHGRLGREPAAPRCEPAAPRARPAPSRRARLRPRPAAPRSRANPPRPDHHSGCWTVMHALLSPAFVSCELAGAEDATAVELPAVPPGDVAAPKVSPVFQSWPITTVTWL